MPSSSSSPDGVRQAVAGVVPPQLREALIREAFPTVAGLSAGGASLAKTLMRTLILAPLGFLLVAPLFYNRIFLVGLMNYTFGIGLALWALATWIYLRERALVLRLLVSMLFCVGLFFCHLFVVGLYGLGLLAFDRHDVVARRGVARDEPHLHAEKPVHGAHAPGRYLVDAGYADRARPLA